MNRIRARSRSTTMRVATHCTRPADSRGMTLRPQHRRDLVAVEPVENPPCLLGVDQATIEVPPVLDGPGDGAGVISWKTMRLTGMVGDSTSKQMPRDGLALAVLVGREIELVGVLEQVASAWPRPTSCLRETSRAA